MKQFNQPVYTFFFHFSTHFLYIEGHGKEAKVHENLILSKMTGNRLRDATFAIYGGVNFL